MPRFFKKISDGPVLAIIMITLTAVITHGLMISRLGYYYDDWYMLWSGAARGGESLIGLFSMDRPFMGVIYSYFYRVIGDNILGWHLFTLLVRIAGGIAFYWILNMVWPKLKSLFILAAMLFVVFPGFLAEPNAATKINHLIGYAAALFSIALTLQAALTQRKAWKYASIALAMGLMAFYVWIYEYMVGLEVMRVALLFWVRWQCRREKVFAMAKKLTLTYIPYALVAMMFVFWRVFIYHSTRPATDLKGLVVDYYSNTWAMLLRLGFQVVKDFFSVSIFAWFVQPYYLLAQSDYGEIVLAFVIAAVVVLLALGYLFAVRKTRQVDDESESPAPLILIGGLITLGAVFPVVLLNRYLDLMNSYKGYGLHPSAGVIIIVVGLVAMLKPKFRSTAMVALLALSVATQTLNIQQWANFWDLERGMWWQLTWRAPNFKDNTLLMAYLPDGYAYQQDYEIWGPVNLIYRPDAEHFPLIQSEVLNQDTALYISQGTTIDTHVRDIWLWRDFKNLLLVSQPTTSSCIHIIDGKMPAYSASERLIVQKAGAYSNPGLIEPSGAAPTPPAAIFGKEPARGWCYYYQQASLARQVGDWGKIGKLYDAAASAGLKPGDASEYFVFIEGLVNTGREKDASAIIESAIKDNDALKVSLCQSLANAPVYPDSFGYKRDQISGLICK